MKFEFSPSARINAEHIGREAQPVIIIDDAFHGAQALVDLATRVQFTPIGPYYPGIRAQIDKTFTQSLSDAIQPYLHVHLGIKKPTWIGDCFFSMVTRRPEDLTPIQRLPHYDGIEENRIAIVYFLCDAKHGGTAYYRHLSSGFETISAERFGGYKDLLESEIHESGLPPPRYIGDGAPLFARTKVFDAAFNRMLIYRGSILHCSATESMPTFSADPEVGRLTINAFLNPI
ncbi:MAG: DUF6445 family protein [Parvularculaceae bacterium]